MSFDCSRFSFAPSNDFLGVVSQQGRVQLDSEVNELQAQFARRIEAGTLDTLGRAVYPPTTPNAFKIKSVPQADGSYRVKIGPGRMYVDGLLVENHGVLPPAFTVVGTSNLDNPASCGIQISPGSDPSEFSLELVQVLADGTTNPVGSTPPVTLDGLQAAVSSDTDLGSRIQIQDVATGVQPLMSPPNGLYMLKSVGSGFAVTIPSASNVQWDPALAELSGAPQTAQPPDAEVDFEQQPYLPGPSSLGDQNYPALPNTGPFLFYLDAWKRPLTYLQRPDLVEKAVGVDTTGRIQIAWQVKCLDLSNENSPPVDCDTDIPEWDDLVGPPAGRLTTGVVQSSPSGPCCLTPNTGYTGLENQLYRVEIHHNGTTLSIPGRAPSNSQALVQMGLLPSNTATFKWSRDNGSVATAVLGISATTYNGTSVSLLALESLGRDQVLGFNPGDWIEITDDYQELLGHAGTLCRIQEVDAGNQTVTLNAAVDAITFPLPSGQLDPARHTRIRRWDQKGKVYLSDGKTVWVDLDAPDATGEIPVPAKGTTLVLESGVTVTFDLDLSGASSSVAAPHALTRTFRIGDYWTFAARASDGSLDLLNEAPPQGVHHHYARLAVVTFPSQPTDCRSPFPPVQPGCDMKLHNRHLHGWGVVCGLQVHCAGDRTLVSINSGHAIVCDGTDVLLKSPKDFPVVAQAKALKLLNNTNSGSVVIELVADDQGQPVFTVAAPPVDPAKGLLQQILEGTIWGDFYEECLQPLIKYYKTDFGANPEDKKLVPDNKRRLTAALNLLYQFANPTVGGRVWLSAAEHGLLQTAYNDLLAALSSQTFCAIKDNIVSFPSYPFSALNITTQFGNAPLVGARIAPDGLTIIAFDNGTTGNFYLFNAATGEMTATLSLTSASPLTVRDVLIFGSADAPQLLVAATGNGNTSLAVFDLKTKLLVGTPQNFFQLEVSRLEISPFDNTSALAVVVGQGLCLFSPANLSANSLARPLVPFNAAGHLAISGNFVVASVAAQGTTTPYTSVMLGLLNSAGGGLQNVALTGTDGTTAAQGTDGLAIVPPPAGTELAPLTVYVGVNAATNSTNKRVLAIDTNKRATIADLTLPTSGPVALTSNGQQLLVALTDECQVLWVDPTKNVVDSTQALPAQIAPVAFATVTGAVPRTFAFRRAVLTRARGAVAAGPPVFPLIAVNRISQTLTVIPANLVGVTPNPVDFSALSTYRDSMIAAFKDLLLRLVQGLKDCLCDRLLLDCPTCGSGDVIYLGTVDIKSGQVYHICNFIRREVLTFPKVKYWLSAVPVIPIIHWLVKKFCCSVLPEFSNKVAPGSYFTVPTTNAIFERIQTNNFNIGLSNTFARYRVLGKYATEAAVTRTILPSSVPTIPSEVLQASPETATAVLAKHGVSVANIADYHTALASDLPLIDPSAVPLNFQPGDKVNLYTQNGRVVYYTRVTTPTAPAAAPTSVETTAGPVDVQGLQRELGTLRTQITSLQNAHAEAQKQIEELKATTSTLQARRRTSGPKNSGSV